MSDSDESDLDTLMLVMARNQIPNLICDTIVEFLLIFVSCALILITMSLSDFYTDQVSCHMLNRVGCPQKYILSQY